MRHILLTIDIEDWFQVENFKSNIAYETWPRCELRVKKNAYRLLNLLDSVELNADDSKRNPEDRTNFSRNVHATFFVLGWIAERMPNLIKEISSRGHEVAAHGYNHALCTRLSADKLRQDLILCKKLLEDLTGRQVYGYRAPSFAIDDAILQVIADCGYLYDSSYNSFGLHDRYGKISLPEDGRIGIARKVSNSFFEIPISNLCIRKPLCRRNAESAYVLAWGGGGVFRLIPAPIFRFGVRSILNKEKAYLFYLHPWEIDPKQPRVQSAAFFHRFRHYTNLDKTEMRLQQFIKRFADCCFISCKQYLDSVCGRFGTL